MADTGNLTEQIRLQITIAPKLLVLHNLVVNLSNYCVDHKKHLLEVLGVYLLNMNHGHFLPNIPDFWKV